MERAYRLIISALMASAVVGWLPGPATASAIEPAVDDALAQDARAYAAVHKISHTEALRRLNLTTTLGELQAILEAREADTFAGMWIEHSPVHKAIVQFTAHGAQTLRRHVAGGPLANMIEVRPAKATLAQLRAAADSADRTALQTGVPFDMMIEVEAGRVLIRVTDRAAFTTALTARGLSLPPEATLTQIASLSTGQAQIYGGFGLSGCTSGFSVVNQYGETGTTTAGHCPNTQYFGSTLLPFIHQRLSGSYDVQWHTTPNITDRPWVADNIDDSTPGYRVIRSTRSRSQMLTNDTVCKFGKTTGFTCGTIVQNNYRPPSSEWPTATATWVLVRGFSLSAKGDSGGPWYYGSAAYGIHTGGRTIEHSQTEAYFMPVEYVSGLNPGVHVILG